MKSERYWFGYELNLCTIPFSSHLVNKKVSHRNLKGHDSAYVLTRRRWGFMGGLFSSSLHVSLMPVLEDDQVPQLP